jgi:hypothetical protein
VSDQSPALQGVGLPGEARGGFQVGHCGWWLGAGDPAHPNCGDIKQGIKGIMLKRVRIPLALCPQPSNPKTPKPNQTPKV